MSEYMIIVSFPAAVSLEFTALIPSHRARVNELMQEGTLTSYSLSADRRTLWMTLLAPSEEEIVKTLATMPLFPFMRYELRELMFHNTPMFATPRFSVN